MRITFGGLKGGISKSTSAVHIAIGLAARGERVLLVDADPQAATVLDWSTSAGDSWPDAIVVVPWPVSDLAKKVSAIAGDFDSIIIDTGGESDTLLAQALLVTDELVIPSGTTLAEIRRLPATFQLAANIELMKQTPLSARILLTKVRAGTRSSADARQLLESEGFPIMEAEIPLRERYSQAFGTVPPNIGEYRAALDELLAQDEAEVPA
ncbi:ParA family protein [Actinopolymorpha sp. B17G11]|uniref:ParA family protein n=1 Tax=Actinopolymorpha sp. B17G11 TaxID=3160861 RepID=UPI0032E4BDE8